MPEYREIVFHPPGGSGHFSRFIFSIWDNLFQKISGRGPFRLLRALLFAGFLVGLGILFISFTVADIALVYQDEGYEEPSVILAKDSSGKYIEIADFYRHDRRVLDLEEFEHPENLKIIQAFIAAEDVAFLSHYGIDIQGILRAAYVNFLAGRVREGASTITQQVARLRFLTRQRSFVRKAREAVLALILETRFSKLDIMELYLNEVPLGHGTIGADAAAAFYFGKPATDLNWGEAALIASLTTRPRDFSPLYDLHESRMKVRVNLRRLAETGVISVADAEEAYLGLERDYYAVLNRSPNESAFMQRRNFHPYVTEYVRYSLPSEIRSNLYTGGYRIYTTIETQHQRAADNQMSDWLGQVNRLRRRAPFTQFEIFDEEFGNAFPLFQAVFDLNDFRVQLNRVERDFYFEFQRQIVDEFALINYLVGESNIESALQHHLTTGFPIMVEEQMVVEGALISIRPDGAITAVVGGSGFNSNNQLLRFISSRRQPGSAFKPILYAAGLEDTFRNPGTDRPFTAATVLDDAPMQFISADLSEYSPTNYAGGYEGRIRMRPALTRSRNTWAVRAFQYLGSERATNVSEELLNLSTERRLPRESTVALGTFEMSPIELVRTYSIFASGGYRTDTRLIEYITDANGNILYDNRQESNQNRERVISAETAAIMTSILQDVISDGTGKGARIPGRQAAGKTGTTNRYTDAWFAGYTPELVTVVHLGYDQLRTLGHGGAGGALAAPVWARYMTQALRGEPVQRFSMPDGVRAIEICELSGKLPGHQCRNRTTEYFADGTQPREVCADHGRSPVQDFRTPQIERDDIFRDDDF